MANLTNYGQQYALAGSATGGILRAAVGIALYAGVEQPRKTKDSSPYWNVTEVANGSGYLSGSYNGGAGPYGWKGLSITPWSAVIPNAGITTTPVVSGSWSVGLDSDGDVVATLIATLVWTAAAGQSIVNIGGAFIYDASSNVLAWWERSSPLTLVNGDTLTLNSLYLKLI